MRTSHWKCSVKKGVVKPFAKFTGKHHTSVEVPFNKAASPQAPTQVFSYEICKIFKNTYFKEHLRTTASITKCEGTERFLNKFILEK